MTPVRWTEPRALQSLYYALRSTLLVGLPRFTPPAWYECDLWAVSQKRRVHEYEVKLTLADFRADRAKGLLSERDRLWEIRMGRSGEAATKHERLALHDPHGPNRFTFVVPELIAEAVRSELPPWAGLGILRSAAHDVDLMSHRAPLLHDQRVSKRALVQARRNVCFRYWSLHESLVYRDECEAIAASTTAAPADELVPAEGVA